GIDALDAWKFGKRSEIDLRAREEDALDLSSDNERRVEGAAGQKKDAEYKEYLVAEPGTSRRLDRSPGSIGHPTHRSPAKEFESRSYTCLFDTLAVPAYHRAKPAPPCV